MRRLRTVAGRPGQSPEQSSTRLRFTGDCNERQFNTAAEAVDSWYHSFFFDNGFEVRGSYDIGRDVASYGFPADLTGMRVLDIGAASGWFSYYFEQLGADVTALDLRSIEDFDTFGRFDVGFGRPAANGWMESFAVMAKLLGSKVRRVRGRAYDVSPELFGGEAFDFVFIGALLMHLRDPIGALMAARSVCRQRLIATNWFMPAHDTDGKALEDVPAAGYPAADLPALNDEFPGSHSWWRPNRSAYELWFRAAGFRSVDVSRTVNLTADLAHADDHNSTTTLLLADARV